MKKKNRTVGETELFSGPFKKLNKSKTYLLNKPKHWSTNKNKKGKIEENSTNLIQNPKYLKSCMAPNNKLVGEEGW